MRKTSAWPLSQICVALIVYASLYPFDQWRDQGIWTWSFLTAPWPKYWLGFDVAANVLGYAPLGFFLTLSAMRMGWQTREVWVSTAAAACLSLAWRACKVICLRVCRHSQTFCSTPWVLF